MFLTVLAFRIGLPPETGLYTTIIGALVFKLLTSISIGGWRRFSDGHSLGMSGAVLVAQIMPEYVNDRSDDALLIRRSATYC